MEVHFVRQLAEEIDPVVGIKRAPWAPTNGWKSSKRLKAGFFLLEWIY